MSPKFAELQKRTAHFESSLLKQWEGTRENTKWQRLGKTEHDDATALSVIFRACLCSVLSLKFTERAILSRHTRNKMATEMASQNQNGGVP